MNIRTGEYGLLDGSEYPLANINGKWILIIRNRGITENEVQIGFKKYRDSSHTLEISPSILE